MGGEILCQEKGVKNDSQRSHFEELHASGRVHECLSDAYAYVLINQSKCLNLCVNHEQDQQLPGLAQSQ